MDDITNCLSFGQKPLIITYADDIILVAPSVCVLQKLLDKCEHELNWLGMSINAKKSCCMRVGRRCDAVCASIITSGGRQLPWVKEIRYLGIYIAQFRYFKGVLHEHKKSFFFRSVNVILGKVCRAASDEVILQLVFSKCIPVLLYDLESISLNRSDQKSLNFTFNRFMMKLFGTTDTRDVVSGVFATATWLGGWVAGWLSVRHTPVLYQNGKTYLNFFDHLVAPSF